MIMIVKTPGTQMGSPAAAEEEGGEAMGGGREESGESSEDRNVIPMRWDCGKKALLSSVYLTGSHRIFPSQ